MGKKNRNTHPCPKCGGETKLSGSGRYHCDNLDCPVSYFQVNHLGVAYRITYCADVREDRI